MICRRSILRFGALGALVGAAPAFARAPGKPGQDSPPLLFLYDPNFEEARVEAFGWNANGVPLLDVRAQDLGVAWRTTIAPLLTLGGGTIAGRTLGSHRMISAIFARERGGRMIDMPQTQPSETSGWAIEWS